MFTALASLLILFVLIRLAISAWRYFTAWLGRGKLLRWATDEIEEQYALGIRTYISNMEAWRAEADHFWQRSKRPRLTRDQRDAIHDAISQVWFTLPRSSQAFLVPDRHYFSYCQCYWIALSNRFGCL